MRKAACIVLAICWFAGLGACGGESPQTDRDIISKYQKLELWQLEPEETIARFPGLLEGMPTERRGLWEDIFKFLTLYLNKEPEAALTGYDEILGRGDELGDATRAFVMRMKSWALSANEQSGKAGVLCDEVFTAFKESPDESARWQAAIALHDKSNFPPEDEEEVIDWVLDAYDRVIAEYGESDRPEILALVAMSYCGRGIWNELLGEIDVAFEQYDKTVELFGERGEVSIVAPVARAKLNKGVILSIIGDDDSTLALYDEIVEQYASYKETDIAEAVARALLNKGILLGGRDETEAAIAIYDKVAAMFSDRKEHALAGEVQRALFNKGMLLSEAGRPADAVAVFEGLIEKFGDSANPDMHVLVSEAYLNIALCKGMMGNPDGELETYAKVINLYEGNETPGVMAVVACSKYNTGYVLAERKDRKGATKWYKEVIEQYRNHEDPDILKSVAKSMLNLTTITPKLSMTTEGIKEYQKVVDLFRDYEHPEIMEAVAWSLSNMAIIHSENQDWEKALEVCGEAEGLYGHLELDASIRPQMASLIFRRIVALDKLGRAEECVAACKEFLAVFGKTESTEMRFMHLKARTTMKRLQGETGVEKE